MPLVIPNTTTAAKPVTFAGNDVFASGFFVIANNPVLLTMFHGKFGQVAAGVPLYLPPGTYPLLAGANDPVAGISFQDAVPGSHAQIFGVLYYPGESTILSGNQFNSVVSPSGSVTPPTANTVIQKDAIPVGTEPILNFIGTQWGMVDNPGATRIDITPNPANALTNNVVVNVPNIDLPWTFGAAAVTTIYVTAGGGTLRNIGTPLAGAGSRLLIKCASGQTITILSGVAGTLNQIFAPDGGNVTLIGQSTLAGQFLELLYDAISGWIVVEQPIKQFKTNTVTTISGTVAQSVLASFTIPDGQFIIAGRYLRYRAFGDWVNNSGGNAAPPRFVFGVGPSVVFDTNTGGLISASVTRGGWFLDILLSFNGSELAAMNLDVVCPNAPAASVQVTFVTGQGAYQTVTSGVNAGLLKAVGSNVVANPGAGALSTFLAVINGSASATYDTRYLGGYAEII